MNARKLFRGLPRLCLLPVFLVVSSVAMAETSTLWLDELDLGGMRQGFGKPQARQSVMGRTLTVAGHAFAKGIGTHAASGLVLDVRGKASRLEALVGVDDEPKTYPGSVEFLVLGDGKVLWKSGLMKGGDSAKPVNIDLNGVKSLELRVTDGGDGNDSDQADWLNARLVVTAPLEHLYPPERRSPEAWNRLSEEQVRRGYGMEEVAAGVWRIRLRTAREARSDAIPGACAAPEGDRGTGIVQAASHQGLDHRVQGERAWQRPGIAPRTGRATLRPGHEPEGVPVDEREEDHPRQRRPGDNPWRLARAGAVLRLHARLRRLCGYGSLRQFLFRQPGCRTQRAGCTKTDNRGESCY